MTLTQRLLNIPAAQWLALWVSMSALINLVIDRFLGVPADSAPEWPAWLAAHPRWAGVVKFFRGGGLDIIKTMIGFVLVVTGQRKHDPSSVYPPDAGDSEGGIE